MEYIDLSPYTYSSAPLPMRTVGWLGLRHGMQGTEQAPMTGVELRQLRAATQRLGSVTLGWHTCEFCSTFDGNGEYRFYLPDGSVYVAPMMLMHYIEHHGYRPPRQLRVGLAQATQPVWDWRADRLHAVLLDPDADLDWRCEAAVDLALWNDRRAFDALMYAARDDLLADGGGEEIGLSLAAFAARGYADELATADFHVMVRSGIDQASGR